MYRHVSRQHRLATGNGDAPETARLDRLTQQLVNGSLPDDVYWELDREARTERRRQKEQRKHQQQKPVARRSGTSATPSVNTADLKKRIFNPQVSRENVIKALEGMPPTERRATITGLPPGLRWKLADYLKKHGH